jgi:hypothetical protein
VEKAARRSKQAPISAEEAQAQDDGGSQGGGTGGSDGGDPQKGASGSSGGGGSSAQGQEVATGTVGDASVVSGSRNMVPVDADLP